MILLPSPQQFRNPRDLIIFDTPEFPLLCSDLPIAHASSLESQHYSPLPPTTVPPFPREKEKEEDEEFSVPPAYPEHTDNSLLICIIWNPELNWGPGIDTHALSPQTTV